MQYVSTRGGSPALTSAEAIKMGLAPDGGLFVPAESVRISPDELQSFPDLSYQDLAVRILSRFLTDYGEAELEACVQAAYAPERYGNNGVAPVVSLHPALHIMELWHGPTCAFKDVALQILPQFMTRAMVMTGERRDIVILVATSGDTGKAALEGFADVPGTHIAVFYPQHGVSEVQKAQMITQQGGNVHVIGVDGNFDDTQTGVKRIFSDASLAARMDAGGLAFSSANSINWGRLVPQIVYYFSAYADLCRKEHIRCGDPVNFAVPTGNFGNILAAWYAHSMGLPIGRLLCASNDNNVLTDFLQTGVYDKNRPFHKTSSPSMDILISSNLERLLYEMTGRDCGRVAAWMESLGQGRPYDVGAALRKDIETLFYGDWTNEERVQQTITEMWRKHGYVSDTHTAVAIDVGNGTWKKTGDNTPTVIASTASPFKFGNRVAGALFGSEAIAGRDEFALLEMLSRETGWPVPPGLANLESRAVLHATQCKPDRMQPCIEELLHLDRAEKVEPMADKRVHSVPLSKLIRDCVMEPVVCAERIPEIEIASTDINRPGLQLAGFFDYFGNDRIQVIGKVEMTYLDQMNSQERYQALLGLFSKNVPCVVLARGMEPHPEMLELAQRYHTPLFKTGEVTSRFSSNLISYLNVELAPMETRHAELIEVYGEGVLILGESGVGKSETALELVKRGHRLVADDLTEIRRVSSKTLVGTAPEIIRHLIEIRGIGILDVKHLYGVGSVKMTENINLIVNMELWNPKKQYERLGMDEQFTEILGIQIPSLTIPVRPGRNLAIIIEVAAMNNRQKKMGYNAAQAFSQRISIQQNLPIDREDSPT